MVKQIQINLSNKMFYTLILIGILIVSSWVVFAYVNPATGVGHDLNELEPCADGQILKTSGSSWACADSVDTSCTASGNTITCPDGTSLTDTDTHGSLSCTTYEVNYGNYHHPCNWVCSNVGRICVSAIRQGITVQCEGGVGYRSDDYCRCCSVN